MTRDEVLEEIVYEMNPGELLEITGVRQLLKVELEKEIDWRMPEVDAPECGHPCCNATYCFYD